MLKIVFMGTPDFAVPSLEILHAHFKVVAVVTAVDKLGGRGHGLIQSPVKKWALRHNLTVLQPKNLKSEIFFTSLQKLSADLFVVVAFRMLPIKIWSMPPKGTINLHASLLPELRGAAPIQRAIMQGYSKSGLTTFKLNEEIDTGEILDYIEMDIGEDETGGELHDRMMTQGAKLVLESVQKIESGKEVYVEQLKNNSTAAPKIFREDTEIKWNQPVEIVYNHIRALIPIPGPWFIHQNKKFKILQARKISGIPNKIPGSWDTSKNKLLINCMDGAIDVLKIQPEGKKIMDSKDFLNGLKAM
jgi:methionyl-tRNA formyltransferase